MPHFLHRKVGRQPVVGGILMHLKVTHGDEAAPADKRKAEEHHAKLHESGGSQASHSHGAT